MTKIRGILFDIDGTLLDSNDAHAQSWVDTFQEAGYEVPFDRVRRLIGQGGDKLLPETVHQEKDSPEGKKLTKRRGEIFREKYLPTLRPFPQARDLLARLHDDGRQIIIATSAEKSEADKFLDIVGVKQLVDVLATSEDAQNSKPDPDIVQAALAKSGLRAEDVLMVGDTPYDVEAAGKAGVRTVAVRCGGWDTPDLKGAVAVYDDPADLLAHYSALLAE